MSNDGTAVATFAGDGSGSGSNLGEKDADAVEKNGHVSAQLSIEGVATTDVEVEPISSSDKPRHHQQSWTFINL